mmetsp:Transcript_14711/g.12944  ORF Transcript_14711/g.12944 Transcript_14711/m.12944 type:complete len:291 (+) Transcript_14711:120-992(+)
MASLVRVDNMPNLNSACFGLNSSPTEFITGFNNNFPNLEYGLTNPGFKNTMILQSLQTIPIYNEVLGFQIFEQKKKALGGSYSTVLSHTEVPPMYNNPRMDSRRIAHESISTTQSCSLNGSRNESSHPIAKNTNVRRTSKNHMNMNAFEAKIEQNCFGEQEMNQFNSNYQPLIVSKGTNVVIPPGFIQVQTEQSCNRKTKLVTKCEHTDKKHYAKGLCSSCYHKGGRTKKSWNCEHKDRVHYAKGCCQDCYILIHSKRGKRMLRSVIEEEVNDIANIIKGNKATSEVSAF